MNDSSKRPSATPSNATTRPEELKPYLAAGWDLIPLHRWDKVETINGKRRKRGKSPLHGNWTRRPYNSRDQVAHMEGGGNVGVRLRAEHLVVDVDPRNFGETRAGVDPFVEFVLWSGIDPDDYPTVVTGSGGYHLYMTKPADVANVDDLPQFPGVEFKSKGRQVVAAGSIHPETGRAYRWDELNDALVDAPAAPPELIDLIARPARSTTSGGGGGEHTAEELAAMLHALDPEDFREHGEWLALMQACHHATGGNGREEFIAWSTSDPAYADDGADIGRRWDSLHADNDGGARVTYRTLHKLLRDAGQESVIPRPSAADDFDVIEDGNSEGTRASLPASGPRPIHEGGLQVHPKTHGAMDTAVNALRAVNGSLMPRFNELKQSVVFAGDLPWDEALGRELSEHTARLARVFLMQRHQGNDYQPSKENVHEAIMAVAYHNKFNPVTDYLDGLTWDGVERIGRLFTDGFMCADDDYTCAVSRCFMIGAVARQREPGCKLDTMPVVKGPQGADKSTGLQDLFTAEWFSDAELGDLRNKDAAMNLDGIWVHEFAELAGLKASDMDVLKAFMSRATDRYRPPYGRTVDERPRRVVFAGTVNEGGYLSDPTGGRRFWPLEMRPKSRVDREWINANRDQLWAEADASYLAGESHVLPESLWAFAADRQAAETVGDPWTDAISAYVERLAADRLDWERGTGDFAREELVNGRLVPVTPEEPPVPDRVHTQTLLGAALGLDNSRQNRSHAMRLRRTMEELGWTYQRSVRIGEKVAAGYIAPTAADG